MRHTKQARYNLTHVSIAIIQDTYKSCASFVISINIIEDPFFLADRQAGRQQAGRQAGRRAGMQAGRQARTQPDTLYQFCTLHLKLCALAFGLFSATSAFGFFQPRLGLVFLCNVESKWQHPLWALQATF